MLVSKDSNQTTCGVMAEEMRSVTHGMQGQRETVSGSNSIKIDSIIAGFLAPNMKSSSPQDLICLEETLFLSQFSKSRTIYKVIWKSNFGLWNFGSN